MHEYSVDVENNKVIFYLSIVSILFRVFNYDYKFMDRKNSLY